MSNVKALYPIGKTQWSKWRNEQRDAFNEVRGAGVPFADAVKYVNELELVEVNIAPPPPKKKHGLLDILEDVADAATAVASVATSVAPVVAVAKTVAKATKPKKKGK